uniref:Neur_chan_LBD domain-containing protein n=1 Tax=Panagrellus redivivus TaxID=6233 RepID=A0A7E4ZWW7_PANRE
MASALTMCRLIGLFILFSFLIVAVKSDELDYNDDTETEENAEKISNMTYSEEQSNLQYAIFKDYPRKMKPLKNQSIPISVQIHVYVMHYSVNQDEQTITLTGYLYMSWIDEYAVWDPTKYNNIRFTMAKQWELWQPEIKIANSVSGVNQYFEISRRSHATLESISPTRTKVQIYPTFNIKIGCSFDYSAYPLDTQRCILRMYPQGRMDDIELADYYGMRPSMILTWGADDSLKHIDEWQVTKLTNNITYFSQKRFTETRPRTALEKARTWTVFCIYITFERKILDRFFMIMSLPCFVISSFNILSFLAPKPEHGLMITIANLFIQVIFLQDFLKELPPSSGEPPAIVTFTDALLVMTLLAMVVHLANKKFLLSKKKLPQQYSIYISQSIEGIKNRTLSQRSASQENIEQGAVENTEAEKSTEVPEYSVGIVVMVTFCAAYTLTTLVLITFYLF